jgi:hypothetical protein
MIQVKSILPPAIFRSHTSNKTFVVAGSHPWIEVPEGTTLADVQWTDAGEEYQKNKLKPAQWEVEGSTGKRYTVKRDESGIWSCNCVGFGFRSQCKHLAQIAEKESKKT